MENHFDKVKNYLLDLDYTIVYENEEDAVLAIDDESEGIKNLMIGCADPLLIMEQYIMKLSQPDADIYKALLKKNRDIIHGAFVLDESGTKVIFRDTLQLGSLDLNELEGSINSLSLLMSEFSEELIQFSKK